MVYKENHDSSNWTGKSDTEELIQLICRTSNGQITEREVRNLFGEAFNEGVK